MKTFYRFGLLLLIIVLLMDCGHKKRAVGPSDMIFVLSNPTTREAIGDAIDTTFSYGLRTPLFEPYFSTNWQPIQKFNSFIRMKSVLVIADLNGPGVGTDIAQLVLSEEQYALAENDSVYLFFVEDYWAEEQSFVLIAGRDYARMRQNIIEQQGWLYEKFNRRFLEDQLGYIYAHNEQKKMPQKFWDHYRWSLRVPENFLIIKDYPEANFVWLGATGPYRWISVSWEPGIQTEWLTPNGLFNRRNEIGELHQGIQTNREYLGHVYTKFNDLEALKMTGVWHHLEEAKGGPFISYAFYDPHSDRSFLIDVLMFAPGEKHSVFLRQLEIMAKTFSTTRNPKDASS